MEHLVEIIQYMPPNGRRVHQSLEVSSDTIEQCKAIQANGFWFECEVLIGGLVSVTITDDDADHAVTLFDNKPGNLKSHFSKMVAKFTKEMETEQC